MYVDLVARQREEKLNLPEISIALTGGSICTPKLVEDVGHYLNVKNLQSLFGLTETTGSSFQSMPYDNSKMTQEFVGRLQNNLEAKVIDENGQMVPFGQSGELCIRGYSTFLGYYQDEKKTNEIMGKDKWLKTGDQFILCENGYGKIVGRLKEMIIRGGENIFPREIEDFLNTHPKIGETHVVGVQDERLGEEIAAYIRLKNKNDQMTYEEVANFCKGKLSHFKVPKFVYNVEEFPRTASGKVQKFLFPDYFKSIKNDK